MKHSRPSARVVQAVAAAAVFTGVTALMCISLCSADDFWYSTFLDGGGCAVPRAFEISL